MTTISSDSRAPYDFNLCTKLPNYALSKHKHINIFGIANASNDGKRRCVRLTQVFHQDASYATDAHSSHLLPGFKLVAELRAYISASRDNTCGSYTVYSVIRHEAKNAAESFTCASNARGYGYDKISAAFANAYHAADIQLLADFGGCGETALLYGVQAVCEALGYGQEQLFINRVI